MNNTQKALINQDVCEQTTPNLGITQSSGLDRLSGYPDKRSVAVRVFQCCQRETSDPIKEAPHCQALHRTTAARVRATLTAERAV